MNRPYLNYSGVLISAYYFPMISFPFVCYIIFAYQNAYTVEQHCVEFDGIYLLEY